MLKIMRLVKLICRQDFLKYHKISYPKTSNVDYPMSEINETNTRICPSKPKSSNGCWLTTSDQSSLFQKLNLDLQFNDTINRQRSTIVVDSDHAYQTMDGFGFTLTGGSAYLLRKLDGPIRNALLYELFSTQDNAIGISYLRLSIGASDLSTAPYSYDDIPEGQNDLNLIHFNILAGDFEVIPILHQILSINPTIQIMATPWSAPAWMKTNNSMIGGSLRCEYYDVYAKYFVKYIQSMKEYGITIQAITPQNEPQNDLNEPSMLMDAKEQANFIKFHLGPALRMAGLTTDIFCWDHNCDRPDYPLAIFADAEAERFTKGSAWHLYAGNIDVLSSVHEAFPHKKIYFTEQWVGSDGQFGGDLLWHGRNVLIGAIRNWSSVVLEWNLAADPYYNPHTTGGASNCVGALTIGDTIQRNVAYYLIAHVAKFVRPNSVRIHTETDCALLNVGFMTPDHTVVLVVLNDSEMDMDFNIQIRQRQAACNIPALALASFVWQDLPED